MKRRKGLVAALSVLGLTGALFAAVATPAFAEEPEDQTTIEAEDTAGTRPQAPKTNEGPARQSRAIPLAGPFEFVSVAGDFTSAAGICSGNWETDCAGAELTYNQDFGLYIGQFDGVPAGDWQFKITLGSWDDNWGAQGNPGGDNIQFTADGSNPLYVIFNPVTKRSFAANTSAIYVVAGSFQDQVGCSGDPNEGQWQPACLASVMFPQQDADGFPTGNYDYQTTQLPAGSWEFKVTRGMDWGSSWGQDGGGGNISFSTNANELTTFTFNVTEQIPRVEVSNPPLPGTGLSQALWIDATTVAWPTSLSGLTAEYELSGYPQVVITPAQLTEEQMDLDWRTKNGYIALNLSGDDLDALIPEILKGEITFGARDSGTPLAATHAQIAGVLDDLYAGAAEDQLGLTWAGGVPTFRLWAPTATSVSLNLWLSQDTPQVIPASVDTNGVWTVVGEASWTNAEYLWDVEVWVQSEGEVVHNLVTDPYSVGLTINSTRSVILDLQDPAYAPSGWETSSAPTLSNESEQTIYELHVRDFSAWDDTVPADQRGTYSAFTLDDTDGVNALRQLSQAGITTLHLLPTFDIATTSINEDRAEQLVPEVGGTELLPSNVPVLEEVTGWGPASELQQAAVAQVQNQDAFNWGYDPFHWMTPEGSYATTGSQVGGDRTREYREMVAALHDMDLRVVQDVVFNHTAASGQSSMSVLDKVVPGYYHRLNAVGAVETSTCCSNVATENAMAEKIMIDALVTQAKAYKIDGFRFDLMGHHSLQNMINVRNALDALTVEKDGVDGRNIYLYGEGWDFGEVAGGALFIQATQGNIAGSDIGAFNDRLRDAVRGGGPFDEDQRSEQGFGTGLYTDPNATASVAHTEQEMLDDLLHSELLIKIGLAGSLKDYMVPKADGGFVAGEDIDYNGQAAGFTESPQESVNYVEAHDNETLFDNSIWKLPTDASMDTRLRMQVLSNATVALGQSPSFWASGTELMRSKSLDRDSYNSGDWFNAIVWDGSWNGFAKGLPIKEKNGDKWGLMGPLLEDATNLPDQEGMERARGLSLDLLSLRASSPLFTLGDADLVKQKLSFPNTAQDATPGVIVMALDDRSDSRAATVDPNVESIVVVFNSTPQTWTETVEGYEDRELELSPIQADGTDKVVKAATWESGVASVPARTVAVFVETAGGAPPEFQGTLIADPAKAKPGQEIVLSGEGWLPGSTVTVEVPGLGFSQQVQVDELGAFSIDMVIPSDAKAGQYPATATDQEANIASASVTVLAKDSGGGSGGSDKPGGDGTDHQKPGGSLPVTGAAVGLILLLAAAAVGTGIALRSRARRGTGTN